MSADAAFRLQPGSSDLVLPGPAGVDPACPADTHPYTVHTYYFGFSIPEAQIGACLYFRAQPAFGLCQGGPVIFRGTDNVALLDAAYADYRTTMPWPEVDGNTITVANGYVIEWVVPGEHVRLRYRSPDGSVRFEVEQRAVTPLLARGHIVPGEDDHHDDASREPGGSEQFLHVTGELDLRGERFAIDCHSIRDRSWNQVRTEDPGGARRIPPLGWAPMWFGDDLALNTTSFEHPDTDPRWLGIYDVPEDFRSSVYSWVVRDGVARHVVDVRRDVAEYHPTLLAATKQRIEVRDEDGNTYVLDGEAVAMSPLYSWPNINFVDSVYRWTDERGRVAHCSYQEICFDEYVRGVRARLR